MNEAVYEASPSAQLGDASFPLLSPSLLCRPDKRKSPGQREMKCHPALDGLLKSCPKLREGGGVYMHGASQPSDKIRLPRPPFAPVGERIRMTNSAMSLATKATTGCSLSPEQSHFSAGLSVASRSPKTCPRDVFPDGDYCWHSSTPAQSTRALQAEAGTPVYRRIPRASREDNGGDAAFDAVHSVCSAVNRNFAEISAMIQ